MLKLNKLILILLLSLALGSGLAVRLTDLDDPPLDFNPTRQLRSAIIARGMYYARQPEADPELQSLAISHSESMEKLEPPVMEALVAWIYLLIGSEVLWVSRIVSSMIWMIGAGLLYDLGRKMETPIASLFGVCYYLFLPFSIRASRSFQPDPAMVMFILFTAWALFQWSQKKTWKWIFLAGLAGGVTGFLKPAGLFFVGGMSLSVVLHSALKVGHEHNQAKDNTQISKPFVLRNHQIWIMALLMIFPLLAYYLFNIGDTAQDYFLNWTVFSRWREVLSPSFYLRWMIRVDNLFNLAVVLAGFLGTLATSGKNRALLWGLWAGYFLFGLVFPYHILTHDYYHLPMVGLVALSLVPFIQTIHRRMIERGISSQFIFIIILLVFSFYHGWIGRSILLGNDYRQHPQFWREVGSAIPSDAKIVGITQDYGFRLMYYGWRKIELWPGNANLDDFGAITQGADYFLVTAKNQLENELAEYLDTYFPIRQEGVGFVLYDLRERN